MNCPKCGTELPDNAKFCDKCGANTAVAAQKPKSEPAEESGQEHAEAPKAASAKRNVIILVLVLALVLIGGAIAVLAIGSDGRSDAQDILNTAERYLSEENYEQAIIEFDRAISIDPLNASAYIGKANAYVSAGDLDKAIQTLAEGYEATGSEEIKARLDELTALQSAGTVGIQGRPVGFTYGDARCLEIEKMVMDCISGTGTADPSMLAEVTEFILYSDCYISVICGNKGGTDLSDTTRFTAQGSVTDIGFAEHLVNASRISIEGSALTDLSPLSGLTKLKELSLFGSYAIADISPLSGLTGLTHLDLGAARITDISPLGGLTSLLSLDLSANSISDISVLSGLTKLEYLDLSGNELTDISAVSALKELRLLDLSINRISDISALSGLTELTSLYLWENEISQLGALSGLTKLEVLDLEFNRITDISPLSGLTAIRQLHLAGNDVPF